MNERIKELAEQCDLPIGYENPTWAYEGAIQKFAELIIQECAQSVAKDFTLWEHVVLSRLEKHFGNNG